MKRRLYYMLLALGLASSPAWAQDQEPTAKERRQARRDARHEVPDPVVRDIRFEQDDLRPLGWKRRLWIFGPWYRVQRMGLGVGRGTSDNAVRTAMEQDESPFLVRIPVIRNIARPTTLDPEALELDAYRVEIWFAHHGYFDAEFGGWEVVQKRPAPRLNHLRPKRLRRGPIVDLVGYVSPGPVSQVTQVTLIGMDAIPSRVIQLRVERLAAGVESSTFDVDAPNKLARNIVRELQSEGYARAVATAETVARPEDQSVQVEVTIDPGPACSFGTVEITGYDEVPLEFIEELVTVRPGAPYDPKALAATQSAIFSLGLFSVVQVSPDLSPERGSVIPVTITVTETRFQEVRVGGGFAIGSGAAEIHAPVRYEHRNVMGRLIRAQLEVEPGYKVFVQNADLAEQTGQFGPVLDVDGELLYPKVFGLERLSHHPKVSFQQARELGYTYKAVAIAPVFSVQLAPGVALSPSYRWKYTWDLDYSSALPDDLPYIPCQDDTIDCSYQLHEVGAQFVVDTRSPLLQPTHGGYLEASLYNAGGPLPGFQFTKATLELRRFQQVQGLQGAARAVVAGRIVGGIARPYGNDAFLSQVPTPERFTLGGGTTVRGFAENLLGPRTCSNEFTGKPMESCRTPLNRRDVDINPNGGEAILYANLELRIDVAGDLDAVVFSDIGGNWESWDDVRLSGLQPTVGAGVRYATVAGPIRLDFGYRLRDDPAYDLDRRWGLYFSIQEAF